MRTEVNGATAGSLMRCASAIGTQQRIYLGEDEPITIVSTAECRTLWIGVAGLSDWDASLFSILHDGGALERLC